MAAFFDMISPTEILYCAVAAAAITYIVRKAAKFFKIAKYGSMSAYLAAADSEIFKKMREKYPIDSILYRDKTLRRGMLLRIKLSNTLSNDGLLAGINSDNALCIISRGFVYEITLEKVLDITIMDDAKETGGK